MTTRPILPAVDLVAAWEELTESGHITEDSMVKWCDVLLNQERTISLMAETIRVAARKCEESVATSDYWHTRYEDMKKQYLHQVGVVGKLRRELTSIDRSAAL